MFEEVRYFQAVIVRQTHYKSSLTRALMPLCSLRNLGCMSIIACSVEFLFTNQ